MLIERRAPTWTKAALLTGLILLCSSALAGGHKEPQPPKNIVATAIAAGTFNTLAAALEAADLVEALQGEGPFTVFAPPDGAFAKLPEGTVESLLEPENQEQLKAVLLYHVVPGKVMAGDIFGEASPATLEGSTLQITKADGLVSVNAAEVVTADVIASNGVIHVIDAVLLPPAD